jgi:hypothetical protein
MRPKKVGIFMKKSIIWQLAIVAILFSTPSYAETSALTLDQVIKESLQKNTSLFRAQRDYEDRMAMHGNHLAG